ncbi:MAG: hypothetical protein EOO19_10335 [Chryseobacterium sp.]|nr:MAG: hypothetical protein EOO19_10335 [Chryseobacterium sp.]
MITVSNFKEKFISNLSNSEHVDEPIKKLERKVSPSLEAYEYVGNNKLDIDPSERSYGLLFE